MYCIYKVNRPQLGLKAVLYTAHQYAIPIQGAGGGTL